MTFTSPVKVEEIHLDFTGDDYETDVLDVESQQKIYDEILSAEWYVVDEEDLIEEITERYGWCVKSLFYVELNDEEV